MFGPACSLEPRREVPFALKWGLVSHLSAAIHREMHKDWGSLSSSPLPSNRTGLMDSYTPTSNCRRGGGGGAAEGPAMPPIFSSELGNTPQTSSLPSCGMMALLSGIFFKKFSFLSCLPS